MSTILELVQAEFSRQAMRPVLYARKPGRGQGSLFADDSAPKQKTLFKKRTEEEGRWVTIHGTHVFIEDGRVKKGPKHMVGKRPDEVDSSGEEGAGEKERPASLDQLGKIDKRGKGSKQPGLFAEDPEPSLFNDEPEPEADDATPPPSDEEGETPELQGWDAVPEEGRRPFEQNVVEPLQAYASELQKTADNPGLGGRYAWEQAQNKGYDGSGIPEKLQPFVDRWSEAAAEQGFDPKELIASHPGLQEANATIAKWYGWGGSGQAAEPEPEEDEPFTLQQPRKERPKFKVEGNGGGKQQEMFDRGENDLEGQQRLFNTDPGDGEDEATQQSMMEEQRAAEAAAQMESEDSAAPLPSDEPAEEPFQLDTGRAITDVLSEHQKAINEGTATAAEVQEWFNAVAENADLIKAEFQSRTMKQLEAMGIRRWSGDKKGQMVDRAVTAALGQYNVSDSVQYSPMEESYLDGLRRTIAGQTDEDIANHAEQFKKREEDHQRRMKEYRDGLENPQTISDFRNKMYGKGIAALSDEELERYDDLYADERRERMPSKPVKETEVAGFSGEAGEIGIVKGYHQKRGQDNWTVTIEQHLGDAYKDALRKAKSLGGSYVNQRTARAYNATPGFQFFSEDAANQFANVMKGESADITDQVESQQQAAKAAQRESLSARASRLRERAEARLNQDRLENTDRRASMAAGIKAEARNDIARAETMERISEGIESGKLKHLQGVRAVTHMQELERAAIRSLSRFSAQPENSGKKWEELKEEGLTPAAIRHAKYPFPNLDKRQASRLADSMLGTPGAVQVGRKLHKMIRESSGDSITISDSELIGKLDRVANRLTPSERDHLKGEIESFKRLRQMDINSGPELRAALREYASMKAKPAGEDPVSKHERELRGKKIPGFFPTPAPVIQQMMDYADIQPGHSVLEPSAGKGDILDFIKESHPDTQLTGLEMNRTFGDILQAKGHEVVFDDFLSHQGSYDRVVMNPPFENDQAISHVQHAFSQLKPGGKLVAVVPGNEQLYAGAARNNRKGFAEFVAQNGSFEPLPEGSFKGVDSFRQTGVNTSLVVLTKPEEQARRYSRFGDSFSSQLHRRYSELAPQRYSISPWTAAGMGAAGMLAADVLFSPHGSAINRMLNRLVKAGLVAWLASASPDAVQALGLNPPAASQPVGKESANQTSNADAPSSSDESGQNQPEFSDAEKKAFKDKWGMDLEAVYQKSLENQEYWDSGQASAKRPGSSGGEGAAAPKSESGDESSAADGGEWITIGGHSGKDGEQHAGGTPVKIDEEGEILAGPDSLEGKDLDELDEDKSGASQDDGAESGTESAASPPSDEPETAEASLQTVDEDSEIAAEDPSEWGELADGPEEPKFKTGKRREAFEAESNLNEVAMEYELTPEELREQADAEIAAEQPYFDAVESVKKAFHKHTGLHSGHLQMMQRKEGRGADASTVSGFDTFLAEAELEGDTRNDLQTAGVTDESSLYNLMLGGTEQPKSLSDPSWLREVAQRVYEAKLAAPLPSDEPFEEVLDDYGQPVPFSRLRYERFLVDRVRKILRVDNPLEFARI